MRKIVQIGKYYPPYYGGIPGYIQFLSEGLRKHYEVTVLVSNTSWRKIEEKEENLRIVRVPRIMELRSTALCPTLPHELRKLHPDIVHLHFPDPMAHFAYACACAGGKSKLVLFWHSDIIRQWFLLRGYEHFLRRILNRADAVIVTSTRLRDNSPWLRSVGARCVVIPFGIDVSRFEASSEIKARSSEVQRRYGDRMLLFVGRLVYYKGLEYLLKAMQGVDGRLLIAGVGPLWKSHEQCVVELGITDKVSFLGSVPDEELLIYLHACRMLVLPSTEPSETFGLVQLEAMACRKPVVSTDLPTGVPWVNQNGRTGLVVPPRDTAALRRAILQILDNPALQSELGERARERVESEFTSELHMQRILGLYEDLLRGSRPGETLRGPGVGVPAGADRPASPVLGAPALARKDDTRRKFSGEDGEGLRIAFLTSRLPYPPMGGDRLRPYYFLKHLLQKHRVTLYAIRSPLHKEMEFDSPDLAGLHEKLFTIFSAGYGWNALKGLFSGLPLQVGLYENFDLQRVLAEDIRSGKIDLILVHLARMAEYVQPFTTVPKILDMVDSLCLHYSRMPSRPRWNPRWAAARFDRNRICRYESTLPVLFDSVLLSSPVDLAAVRARSKAENLVLVPNGVDLERYSFNERPPDPNRIVFFGKLDYLPNSDAAIYFAKKILPHVRKQIPKASFVIAGWNPTSVVRALGESEGVAVERNVEDVRQVVACASVSVAPLRFGAGTQYKILESLALGVPVVATPNAARGFMETEAKLPILVAEQPSEFAGRVVEVMRNASYRERLRREGRSTVESHYGWVRVLSPLDGLLENYRGARETV